MTSHAVLAVDGGQGGCRALIADSAGQTVDRADGPGFAFQPNEDPVDGVRRSLRATLAGLGRPEPGPTLACAGVTGPTSRGNSARDVAAALMEEVPTLRRVMVTGDHVTSYAGALGLRPGAVVAAGTGVIALAVGPGGLHRADGWGYLLGDDGGGFWVGQQGLRAALRHVDGRVDAGPLHAAAGARYGPLRDLLHSLYPDPAVVSRIAAFAEDVAACAGEGDPVAAGLWVQAGRHLADTCAAAAGRAHAGDSTVSVATTGSLFRAGPLLLDPFAERLAQHLPQAVLVTTSGSALDGAQRLARTLGEPAGDATWDAFAQEVTFVDADPR